MSSYFYITKQGDRWVTQGRANCSLGHKIDEPGSDKPDGIYAEWNWNRNTLKVTNDRYGMFPLFYFHTPTSFGVSTSITELLKCGAPARLDTDALGIFLRLGYFIKDETVFRDIRAMEPIKTCTWQDGKLVLEFQRPKATYRDISRNEAIEEYIERFSNSIRKRIVKRAPSLLPLSGGRDSRHILFELIRNEMKPDRCMTSNGHPATSDADIEVARILTKRFDIPHDVISTPKAKLDYERRKNEINSFSSLEHAWYLGMGDYMRDHGFNTVYEGIFGDNLSEGPHLNRDTFDAVRKCKFEFFANELLPGKTEVLLREFVNPDIMKQMTRENAIARLADEVKRYTDTPNPISNYLFWNRTRRSIASCPYSLCDGVEYVYTPYLDRDVYDFLTSLDGDKFFDTAFHEEVIEHAFPEYSTIPYARKGTRASHGILYYLKYLKDLMMFTAQHRNTLLKSGSLGRIVQILKNAKYRKATEGFAPLTIYLSQVGTHADKYRQRCITAPAG